MTKPRQDGSILYEHLQQLEKSTGKWPSEYEPIPPPEGTEYIWDIFWELRGSAHVGFGGPERLSFADIDAWERVRELKLASFVIDLIVAMDVAFINERYRK